MNIARAKQIFGSEETVAVMLEDEHVWIEEVDEANEMATVTVGSNPINTKTVSVDRLQESTGRSDRSEDRSDSD